jgi:hypothetical protein
MKTTASTFIPNLLILTALAIVLCLIYGISTNANCKEPKPEVPEKAEYILILETEEKEYIALSTHKELTDCVFKAYKMRDENVFCEPIEEEVE